MYSRNTYSRYPKYAGRNNSSRNFGRRNVSRKSIDISLLVHKGEEPVILTEKVSKQSFKEFNLSDQVLQSVANRGYSLPTPIQDKAIEPILQGKDLLGIANTGTGKTGAFLIPIINQVIKNRNLKVLILAPTRELAVQINDEFRALANNLNLYSVLCLGGVNIYQQKMNLKRNYNFLIATPGRLLDLGQQRAVSLSPFNIVVLDEVDRMLDMGFVHDVREILNHLPQTRQSLFFSATVSDQIMRLIQEFSHDLVHISVKTGNTAATIDQDIVRFHGPEDKLEVLHKMLIQKDFEKVLIFGRTKFGVSKLSQKLNDRGFRTESIHGNKTQPQRQRALQNFRQNRVNVLVATDVAARGLDIDNVTHVINYDLPESYDDYIHRIGRTGRANKKGMALSFVG